MAKTSRRSKAAPKGGPKNPLGLYPCYACAKLPVAARTIMGDHYVICVNPRCHENPTTKHEPWIEFAVASWNTMACARLQEMHDEVVGKSKEAKVAKKTTTTKVNRDAGTGKFVKEDYAKKHPKTTVTETVKRTTPPKKKK